MRYLRLLLAAFAAVALVLGVTACEDESAGPEEGATVEDVTGDDGLGEDDEVGEDDADIFGDPESFVGQQVTVSGDVTSIITPRAFRLSGDDVGGQPLLVFSAQDQTDLSEGQTVQVQGTVQIVAQETFEEDFGFEFDTTFSEFEGEHAIAASSVQVLQTDGGGED